MLSPFGSRPDLWDLVATRTPGCGERCSARYGHDPIAHERHGMAVVYAQLRGRPSTIVRTGPLEVHVGPRLVYVDGAAVALTPLELEIMLHLARCLGSACSKREIVSMCWDAVTADVWGTGGAHAWHGLRAQINRLRRRLGTAAPLIETVLKFGYRLNAVPPRCEEDAS